MRLSPDTRRRWQLTGYILFGMIVLVTIVSGMMALRKKPVVSQPQAQSKAEVKPEKQQMISGHYLFNGTIIWGRAIEKWSTQKDGKLDYTHPFSQLDSFDRQAYDAWVADLECPITNKTVSFTTQVNELKFNCRPEFVRDAAKYFNILDLANNHTDNMGSDGIPSTRKYLESARVQYYGHYDPSVTSDVCETIALPVRLVNDDKSEEQGELPVAFCAWHYFYRTPRTGEIEAMKAVSDVMPVFAFVHMGAEYNKTAQPTQVAIAHQVADQNPEFVIANNPHWVQNSEVYKGKLIVYSTGNFIFDQLDSEGMRSASIDASFSIKNDENTKKWLEIGKQCKAFHDDCLQMVHDQKLVKPKLNLTYKVVAGDNSNHVTKKGDAVLQKAIEERLNWQATLKSLGQN